MQRRGLLQNSFPLPLVFIQKEGFGSLSFHPREPLDALRLPHEDHRREIDPSQQTKPIFLLPNLPKLRGSSGCPGKFLLRASEVKGALIETHPNGSQLQGSTLQNGFQIFLPASPKMIHPPSTIYQILDLQLPPSVQPSTNQIPLQGA
jgi:hypothetical protein